MTGSKRPVSIDGLGVVTLVVADQVAALEWYTEVLGFEVRADEPYAMNGEEARWLTVAPAGDDGVEIALVEPDPDLYDDERLERLRELYGTDHWWTFETDDIEGTMAALRDRDVTVDETVRETAWGCFAMFEDPDGNVFQLYGSPADGAGA